MFEKDPSSQDPIRSRDLVLPSLLVLAQAEQLGLGPLTSGQLENALRPAMPLTSADTESTPASRGTRFGRTVRNLVSSHQTLMNLGLARQAVTEDDNVRVSLEITPKGQERLFDHLMGMMTMDASTLDALMAEKPVLRVVEDAPRTRERDLVDVALIVLAQIQASNDGKPVSNVLLRRGIKAMPGLAVSPEDLKPMKSETTPRLDRVLYNLTGSHKTLTKNRWARETSEGLSLTRRGKRHLLGFLLSSFPAPPIQPAPAQPAPEAEAPTRRRAPGP